MNSSSSSPFNPFAAPSNPFGTSDASSNLFASSSDPFAASAASPLPHSAADREDALSDQLSAVNLAGGDQAGSTAPVAAAGEEEADEEDTFAEIDPGGFLM